MPSTNGHGSTPGAEKVALYLRVSSEEQREFLTQYGMLPGYEIVKTYADDGISGAIPLYDWPEGGQPLGDLAPPELPFATVLVYRLDRFGRSLLGIVDASERIESAGVALRSATEPIDTSTLPGRLIFQMLASFAEFERGSIRERTQAGLHRALRNDKFSGRLPTATGSHLTRAAWKSWREERRR
jgi:site-specific DNA recombinase